MATGLLIAGMGRSGTSVAAQLAVAAGLRPPPDDDLMPANHANPGGYWESVSLSAFNDRLLARLGATWWTPPAELTPAMIALLDDHRGEAADRFVAVFGTEPGWVWKDPRLTVLLPFWVDVLPDVAVVVPVREPVAVARSLALRDGLTIDECLAIAERHARLLLRALEGLPVLISRYEHLAADPAGWMRNLLGFATGEHLPAMPPALDLASIVALEVADGRPAGPAPVVPAEHVALHATMVRHLGRNRRFPAVDLPPPTPTTAALIDALELPSWARPADPG